jgi:hypothetical protein
MHLKASFYDKLYCTSERMYHPKKAKQKNIKRIMKTSLLLDESKAYTAHTLAQ